MSGEPKRRKFEHYEAEMPDHELIIYRTDLPLTGYPKGAVCLIAVPKAKIAEVEREGGTPPFWRHGETMRVRPAGEERG